jgi:hypothetical protein
MSFSDLGGYRAEIADWMQRTDVTTAMAASFVNLAIAEVNADMTAAQMESLVTSSLDDEFNALPADFVAMRALRTSAGEPMAFVTPSQFQMYVDADYTPDQPIYTVEDMSLRVLPAPSVASPLSVVMLYQASNAELSATDAASNWMMSACPQVLFYAALAKAFMWAHSFDKAMVFETKYQEEFRRYKRQNKALKFGAGPLKMVTGE